MYTGGRYFAALLDQVQAWMYNMLLREYTSRFSAAPVGLNVGKTFYSKHGTSFSGRPTRGCAYLGSTRLL